MTAGCKTSRHDDHRAIRARHVRRRAATLRGARPPRSNVNLRTVFLAQETSRRGCHCCAGRPRPFRCAGRRRGRLRVLDHVAAKPIAGCGVRRCIVRDAGEGPSGGGVAKFASPNAARLPPQSCPWPPWTYDVPTVVRWRTCSINRQPPGPDRGSPSARPSRATSSSRRAVSSSMRCPISATSLRSTSRT